MISTTIVLICFELLTIADGQRRRFNSFETEPMQKTEMDIPTNAITVQGVVGLNASLPCNIQSQNNSDSVAMVLWFKEPNDEPVYSYDARNLRFDKTKVSGAAEYSWSNRGATPRDAVPAYLVIQNVQESDGGEYRCRVDFHNSPTKNLKVNFTIIVPPSKPIIYDTKRRDMSKHLEAYPEGADLDLICEVHGGKPKPRVSWYLESRLINSTYETKSIKNSESNVYSSSDISTMGPYTVINSRVTIKNLKRSHHHAKLSCRADNTQLAAPQTTKILIELNMKPLKIEILEKEERVSANKKYKIKCRSTGSRPAATLTWYKGSKQLKNSSRDKDETSISILEWVPNAEDEGKYLTCRAENRHLPEAAIEDKWKLKVLFSPIVLLRVGSSANLKDIKEGDNVSFECNVRSNPTNFTLRWYHGNKELHHNVSAGVVLSDQSLNLQGISREASGNYSCLAANSQGRNRSNIIYLHVMFAPICKRLSPINLNDDDDGGGDDDIYAPPSSNHVTINDERQANASSNHGIINLVCEVEASPSTVTFHWTFNNTRELSDIPESRYTNDDTLSKLAHLLRTDADYGTFGCWASNLVGHSKQPCIYLIPPPVSPLPLQNCTAHNQSGTWIRISCVEGFDGGLPQKFVAVVGKQRWESNTPDWEIEIHKPTTVSLYAVNAKGSSDPIIMEGIAFKDVAKFTGETGISLDISPILIGLGGTATGLGLIVTGVLMALWRKHAASPSKPKPLQQPTIATFAVKGEEEDGNPDLIPTAVLTNNYTDGKLSVYGSLPRRSHYTEDEQLPQGVIQDINYPRAAPNTYYSLQRPSRYTETIVRHTTVQESCI